MKANIRLYRSEHAWIADFGDDPFFLSALGTGEIPLPFTRNASASVVMAHVVERNPDAEVFIDFIGESASGQPSPIQSLMDAVSETSELTHSARGAA